MRKRKIRRSGFNMVEIMLAVIVIALGIAGTFVLFPVGLNANKDATAENSIADIAEYVTAFVRAEVAVSARADVSGDASGAFDGNKFANCFYKEVIDPDDNSVTNEKYADAIDVDSPESAGWEAPDTHNSSTNIALYRHKSEKGVFLVRQLSGPEESQFVDFAAVARVYLDNAEGEGYKDEYFCNPDSTYLPYGNGDGIAKKIILPAVLELSWPATVPFDNREKRYFRFEIFNDQFEVRTATVVGGTP